MKLKETVFIIVIMIGEWKCCVKDDWTLMKK
jgi:hypothetical protein